MRLFRVIAGVFLVALFFAALAILGWATRHPDHPWVTAAWKISTA